MDSSTAPVRDANRSAVIEAAVRILGTEGAQGLTTRAVAQSAGVAAPTIFRLFNDKDGLIVAVAEHVLTTYMAEKSALATSEEGDPVQDLRAAWRTHIDFSMANPDLAVLLATPGPLNHSSAVEMGAQALRTRIARIAAAGLLRVSQERAVDMIHSAGVGVALALLTRPEHERDLGLADAMCDAVLDRILVARPTEHAPDPTSVVVAFEAVLPTLPTLTDAERGLATEWAARVVADLQDGS